MQVRPVRHPQDLGTLDRLFDECRMADGHGPIGEHKYLALLAGGSEAALGRIVEDGGSLIGYFHLSPRREGEGWVLEVAIHPGHRHPAAIRNMVQSALDLATGTGRGAVRAWVYHPLVAQVVTAMGFRIERQLLQMRMTLPPKSEPVMPVGIRLASFRKGSDEAAWLEVNNRTFAGHPENGGWTAEILSERIYQPWFDAAGLLMGWQGDELVGFCWTKVHPGDLGEVYVLAVDPRHQRRSLGTWLTLEGLTYLHGRRNALTAMVYVDATNGVAVGMYERLGFELDHIDRSYVWEG